MTIKDDIALVRSTLRYAPGEGEWEALDRIEAALTPPADRQAALDALGRIHRYSTTRYDGDDKDFQAVEYALTEPAPVPEIEGLEEAISNGQAMIDAGKRLEKMGYQATNVFAKVCLPSLLKAARAYAALMKRGG